MKNFSGSIFRVRKNLDFAGQVVWSPILASPLICCVILGTFLNLSVFQFIHLSNKDNHNISWDCVVDK